MDKIILKALELAGYKDANTLAKIISYVPNPQIATEMLLGIHTPKEVGAFSDIRKHKWSSNEQLVRVLSYDELANTVVLQEARQKTQMVWYITKEDKQNKQYVTERPKDYVDYTQLKVEGVENRELVVDIADFESDYPQKISVQEYFSIINSWNGVHTDVVPTLLD